MQPVSHYLTIDVPGVIGLVPDTVVEVRPAPSHGPGSGRLDFLT